MQRDAETGEEPTRTSAWKKTRYSDKKMKWVDKASEEAYVSFSMNSNLLIIKT